MEPGKYFEEFEIGDVFITPRRTITETDLVQFAGMSGDFNPIHTDHVYAAASPYGQPVVYGLLILSIVTGLTARLGIFDGTIIAMLGINDWRFVGPVFIGDTIHVRMVIADKRETSKADRGILVRSYEVFNQRDEVVQTGAMTLMIRRRRTDNPMIDNGANSRTGDAARRSYDAEMPFATAYAFNEEPQGE